jgi:hypothetical protein
MKKFLFASAIALGIVFFMACSKEDTTNATTNEVNAQAATSNITGKGLTAEDRSGYCNITINYNNDGPCGPGEFNVVLWTTTNSGKVQRNWITNAGILYPDGNFENFPDPASGTTSITIPIASGSSFVINGDLVDPRVSAPLTPWVNMGATLDIEFQAGTGHQATTGVPYHIQGAQCDCTFNNNSCTAYGQNEIRKVSYCSF